MADAVGLAASVIAIINLSAKVAVLCLQYSTAVGNARADITRLRSRLDDLGTILQGVQHLLDNQNNQALATSRKLVDSVNSCTSELVQLQSRLDPGKARKAMRHFGLHALKWPFNSKEVSDIVFNLERYKQTITLGISLQPKKDTSIAHKPYFSLPFERNPDFVDRPDIMVWIKKQYTGPVCYMALIGIGGFGKSQVAIQFAHHIRDISPQTSIFWVHASLKPRFEEAYQSIADNLRLPRRNDPSVDILGLVRDWLQREEAGPWLMVLDNVDDVNLFYPSSSAGRDRALLAVFLLKRRNGIILVTSRSIDAAKKLIGSHKAVYRISAIDNAQALQLFHNKLQRDSNKTAAADLLRTLDYIPLAITQAAAYINRCAPCISVKTYLDAFQESDKKKGSLLNSDTGDLRRDKTVSNSVIRRERPSAANLLSLISFFNPQGIPEFVLYNYKGNLMENADGLKDDEDNDEFEDDLDVLRGYLLVSVTAKRDMCEIYTLVQFCTCIWLSIILLPHIKLIVEEEPLEKDLEQWAYLLTNCAWYLVTTGSYKAAEKLSERAVKTRANVLGEEHPDMLNSMANLAAMYSNQGRWMDAEELEVRVIETRKTVLGEEHPYTLAKELEVQLIETMKIVLGEEYPRILSSIASLAATYWNQGRWKEAEELQVRVMEIMKTVLGEEHPDTLSSMANLASTYRNQGRWMDAEKLEVRVMETTKTVLGEEHPHMLSSMANLAVTWKHQGRTGDALALMRNCVALQGRVLGIDHPAAASSSATLAKWEGVSNLSQGRSNLE
ncbi:P-loop containing nucleoside triphosphate hydrolase protein [Ilyonectria robusta]|uniref:P-loop containing nucleoside triphosphate hydrolase protein n=1 Tax=Ilyonectria robusta TaxID=1079257 RepID=UPI001E8E217F|nr:P-loop containing nucleoside triphosphate hydrolase protein [Ilyonectria robusta]KAH8674869.1 P-loop containing nucleoside triphosphate hydrolase protein [Ilyonectria robusta]